jgi:phytoene dehydrogenase-like protein
MSPYEKLGNSFSSHSAVPTLLSSPTKSAYDAVIIGSGPNGFSAGITLARAGLNVLMIEGQPTIGGGMRTKELTLPGFQHDVCSAVHPMGIVSPFFASVPLAKFGLTWDHPEVLLAHPLADGRAAVMYQDISRTASLLEGKDAKSYEQFYTTLKRSVSALLPDLLGPLTKFPRHPFRMAMFGLAGMRSAAGLAQSEFTTEEGQAMFAGHAAHSILPLEKRFTAAVGIMLATTGHMVGWPVARGGSQSIANALGRYFNALGGEIVVGWQVQQLASLPKAKAYLFDTGPRALSSIAGDVLPEKYRKQLQRFRYGPGAFKLDLALSGPIPWLNESCLKAGTVHVGGHLMNMIASEEACWQGRVHDKPFVLVAQQSVLDPTRAPAGQHTCWAYCHTPPGYEGDLTETILNHIESYAPGFRDLIIGTSVMRPNDFAAYNPNYVGGDIIGGVQDLVQMIKRPVWSLDPYATPAKNVYLCSSSTPPGGGVHGMCGFHAAKSALRRLFGLHV